MDSSCDLGTWMEMSTSDQCLLSTQWVLGLESTQPVTSHGPLLSP